MKNETLKYCSKIVSVWKKIIVVRQPFYWFVNKVHVYHLLFFWTHFHKHSFLHIKSLVHLLMKTFACIMANPIMCNMQDLSLVLITWVLKKQNNQKTNQTNKNKKQKQKTNTYTILLPYRYTPTMPCILEIKSFTNLRILIILFKFPNITYHSTVSTPKIIKWSTSYNLFLLINHKVELHSWPFKLSYFL